MGIDILREILAAKSFGADPAWREFGDFALRYTLEYRVDDTPPDLVVERTRIAELLASDDFALSRLAAGELPEFLLLSFPGVERVLPDDQLFTVGYEIASALGLKSCEPDLGTPYYADPAPADPAAAESVRVVDAVCLSNTPAPEDMRWALACARIDKAWAHTRGGGILIAQPDTGVALHDELPPADLGLDRAIDILTGKADPTDPLGRGMANPGHGTATGSVAAGRTEKRIVGAAPRATLIPIRCINDVKIFNAAPVAAAIAHAIRVKADVISMSLGGIPSSAIHKAVRRAVAADMIVVAAAGNCVRTVVWPARYAEVIAVGGTNISDHPWKGSSRGGAVDICAPAESVWVARRESPSDTDLAKVEAGQGTSFATALVAGCAALWLAHHGRDKVIEESRRRDVPVQYLFRSALTHTARRPEGWDVDAFGAGIIDAERLLSLELGAIPGEGRPEAGRGSDTSGAQDFLIEEAGTAIDPGRQFLPEIANIALRQRRNGVRLEDLRAEAKHPGTIASEALMTAIRKSSNNALAGLLLSERGAHFAPPAFAIDDMRLDPSALLRGARSQLEAAGGGGAESVRRYLADGGQAEQLLQLQRLLEAAPKRDPILENVLPGLVRDGLDVLGGRRLPDLRARTGLEALVLLNGRPALRITGGRVDLNDPLVGDWHDRLFMYFMNDKLSQKIASIGRIDADNVHWGTGFVIGTGLVLTNRHVLQELAAPVPRRNGPDRWILTKSDPVIDFAEDPSSATTASKFGIVEVVGAGDKDIDPYLLDFAKLDVALLRVETVNAAGSKLPDPIKLVKTANASDARRQVLTIGYPAAPTSLPRIRDNVVDMEILTRLEQIFGASYGRKYLAPGEIMKRGGSIFYYDATTLAGCSGSAVLRTDVSFDALGLHFGGKWRTANYAHDLPALHGAAPLLHSPDIGWVA